MTDKLDTHGFVMPNGKHEGERITRVPVSYLKWMVNANHSSAPYAKAELERRGTVTPEVDISGHAIDRASLRFLRIWREGREPDEGLHAWLARMASEALVKGEKRGDRIAYGGVLWVFDQSGCWPVLTTVLWDKHTSAASAPPVEPLAQRVNARLERGLDEARAALAKLPVDGSEQ